MQSLAHDAAQVHGPTKRIVVFIASPPLRLHRHPSYNSNTNLFI